MDPKPGYAAAPPTHTQGDLGAPPSYDQVITSPSQHPTYPPVPQPITAQPYPHPSQQPYPHPQPYGGPQYGAQPYPPPCQPPYENFQQPVQMVQNTVIVRGGLSNQPTHTACPQCLKLIQTRVVLDYGMRTHVWALIICIFCPPFCFLPYCCNACQEITHYCPHCNAYIGKYDEYSARY